MREWFQSLLLRSAFGPSPQNILGKLLKRLARAVLHSSTDPALRKGEFETRIAPEQPTLRARPEITSPVAAFAPLQRPVAFPRGAMIEVRDHESWRIEPSRIRPVDPDIRDWLLEVTEPYILWDAPKPPFVFSTDYFYDYAEPVPQAHMPLYVRPVKLHRPAADNPGQDAFTRLSNDRLMFTLTPEAVRLHRTRHKEDS